jgi:hypothetical protein
MFFSKKLDISKYELKVVGASRKDYENIKMMKMTVKIEIKVSPWIEFVRSTRSIFAYFQRGGA